MVSGLALIALIFGSVRLQERLMIPAVVVVVIPLSASPYRFIFKPQTADSPWPLLDLNLSFLPSFLPSLLPETCTNCS